MMFLFMPSANMYINHELLLLIMKKVGSLFFLFTRAFDSFTFYYFSFILVPTFPSFHQTIASTETHFTDDLKCDAFKHEKTLIGLFCTETKVGGRKLVPF